MYFSYQRIDSRIQDPDYIDIDIDTEITMDY